MSATRLRVVVGPATLGLVFVEAVAGPPDDIANDGMVNLRTMNNRIKFCNVLLRCLYMVVVSGKRIIESFVVFVFFFFSLVEGEGLGEREREEREGERNLRRNCIKRVAM